MHLSTSLRRRQQIDSDLVMCHLATMRKLKVVHDYMQACGITQKELADRIGCDPAQLNHWLSDRRDPSVGNLAAIWDATGISPEKLLSAYRRKPERSRP